MKYEPFCSQLVFSLSKSLTTDSSPFIHHYIEVVIQVHLYNTACTMSHSTQQRGHRSIDKLYHPPPPSYT